MIPLVLGALTVLCLTAAEGQRESGATIKNIKGTRAPAPARTAPRRGTGSTAIGRPNRVGATPRPASVKAKPAGKPKAPPVVESPSVVLVSRAGGGQYTRVADAIRGVKPGTRIRLRAGIYREGLVVDKPVTIEPENPAEPGSVIVQPDSGSALVSTADQVTVRGLLLRGGESAADFVVECRGGQLMLDGCDISSAKTACLLARGDKADLTLLRSVVRNSRADCVLVDEGASLRADTVRVDGAARTGVCVVSGKAKLFAMTVEKCRAAGVSGGKQSEITIVGGDYRGNATSDIEVAGSASIRDATIGAPKEQLEAPAQYGIRVLEGGRCQIGSMEIMRHRLAGICVEKGEGTRVTETSVRGSERYGILIRGASCRVEECEVYENVVAGIEVMDQADPVIRRSRIHHNRSGRPDSLEMLYGSDFGIHIVGRSTGLIEDCEIYANGGIGLLVVEGSNPTVRNTKSYDNLEHGMEVNAAMGTFENVECWGNANCGFLVQQKANPNCAGGVFRDNAGKGLAAHNASGSFMRCEMRGNGHGNVMSLEGSSITLRQTKMLSGGQYGLVVTGKSRALLEDCEIAGNRKAPTFIEAGSAPQFIRCAIR